MEQQGIWDVGMSIQSNMLGTEDLNAIASMHNAS